MPIILVSIAAFSINVICCLIIYMIGRKRGFDAGKETGIYEGKSIMLNSMADTTQWKTTDNYNGIW